MTNRMQALRERVSRSITIVSEQSDKLSCLCPRHDDHVPSLVIDLRKAVWYCYACGVGGHVDALLDDDEQVIVDVADLLDEIDDALDEADALVASGARLVSTQDDADSIDFGTKIRLPDTYLDTFLRNEDRYTYWMSRGLSREIIDHVKLGFDISRNHAVLPMRDHHGGLLGIIRRSLNDNERKYLYPFGIKVHNLLLGADLIDGRENYICIAEGFLDALALHDVGCPAVALGGVALSNAQRAILSSFSPIAVVMCQDADAAGRRSADKASEILDDVLIARLPYPANGLSKDPADMPRTVRRQAVIQALESLYQPIDA